MISSMKTFDLVFVTTSSSVKLLESYFECILLNNNLKLLVVLVCQKGIEVLAPCSINTSIHIIKSKKQMSLSLARNYALEWLEENKIKFPFIMFPDDDSTFDQSFFYNFKSVVNEESNFLIDVKNHSDAGFFIKHHFQNGEFLDLKYWNKSCSVNMIINSDTMTYLKRFDENLGVGAKYGAGEDCDIFIRSVKGGFSFIFTNELYTMHPAATKIYCDLSLSMLIKRFNNYGRGVVYVLMKHDMNFEALKVCFRGFLGSLIFALKGKFKLSSAYFISFLGRIQLMISIMISRGKNN